MSIETKPEYYSIHATNSLAQHNSAVRSCMYAKNTRQTLVIEDGSEKRIQSGAETKIGAYKFDIRIPEDCIIVAIIHKYALSGVSIRNQIIPETVIMFESEATGELGYVSVPYHSSYHSHFGYQYLRTEDFYQLTEGAHCYEGMLLADTPTSGKNGGNRAGIELNTAFMTIPGVSEDGIVICKDVLPRLNFRCYETYRIGFGTDCFPLNIHGTEENFKSFPDIGEIVGRGGILFALRDRVPFMAPVMTGNHDLMEVDHIFDKPYWLQNQNGRVIDIDVNGKAGFNSNDPILSQINKYGMLNHFFYGKIIDIYNKFRMNYRHKFNNSEPLVSPELSRLLMTAYANCPDKAPRNPKMDSRTVHLLYKNVPLDYYQITFKIEHVITPREGNKLTDIHGSKGIICTLLDPENMPVDLDGNRADIIMDPNSKAARMNPASLIEQYIGAAGNSVSRRIREQLILQSDPVARGLAEKQVRTLPQSKIKEVWDYLVGYMDITCKVSGDFHRAITQTGEQIDYLLDIIENGLYTFWPIDNENDAITVIKNLEQHYPQVYGPVAYISSLSGRRIPTKEKIRIGPIYYLLLDKTTMEYSAVGSGRLNQFGILSTRTESEKYLRPWRDSSNRIIGETEGRILVCYGGRILLAELMDRNGSTTTHRAVCDSIIRADDPMNITNCVDREVYPYGQNRPLQITSHILLCAGVKLKYVPESDTDWNNLP